ncbi:MAG: regulatory protein RecX [Acidobacteriaceae bacterium]
MAGRRGAARSPLDQAGLMEYAVRSLSSRMRSERDLRRKMMQRAEPGEAGAADVEAILQKLKELRYLSDERFAADYTRLRKENERFGRRRVAQGLMQQGVPQELASTALEAAYAEVDEVALAKEYVARKRMKKPEDEKATARAARRLLGAGFSSQTVWKVLRQWGAEVQEVDVDEPHDGESEEGA